MWIGSRVMSTPAKSRPDEDDLAQRLVDPLAGDDGDVERDGAVREAAALVDLGLLGAGDDVAGGELHLVRRVPLHEPLALGVEQVRALAAGALGDQKALARQRRRVVLDHLHVHQRRAGAVGHRDPVAGADQRVGRRLPDLPVAAGGEDHALRLEELGRAVLDVAGDGADAATLVVDREVGREPLLVAVDLLGVLHELLVEHVHDRLAGDVGDVVGPCLRSAAEGAGPELALLVAVEGDADVLEVQELVRSLAAHHLDRVLVAQVVGALDRVERVGLPRVVDVEGRVDAALRRIRMRADGMDLADDSDRNALLGGCEGRALSGESGSDHQYVMFRHEGHPMWSSGSAAGRKPDARGRFFRVPPSIDGCPFGDGRTTVPDLATMYVHRPMSSRSGEQESRSRGPPRRREGGGEQAGPAADLGAGRRFRPARRDRRRRPDRDQLRRLRRRRLRHRRRRRLRRDPPRAGNELGDPEAPVTMVEFADLQCPFCKEYTADVLPDLVEKYVKIRRRADGAQPAHLHRHRLADARRRGLRRRRAGPDVAVGRRRLRAPGAENSGYADSAFIDSVSEAAGANVAEVNDAAGSSEVSRPDHRCRRRRPAGRRLLDAELPDRADRRRAHRR